MDEPEQYYCDDEELGKTLHQLFVVEGYPDVEIQHPTEGNKIITKEEYFKHLENINKAKNMSPAERLVENKRLKNKQQIRFRTAMIDAKSYVINVDDETEGSFGFDINGKKIDLEGKEFVPVSEYLPGVDVKENEIGSFVDESMRTPPIRIIQQVLPEKD